MKGRPTRVVPAALVLLVLLLFSQPVAVLGVDSTFQSNGSGASQNRAPSSSLGIAQQDEQSGSVANTSSTVDASSDAPKVVQTQDYNFRITTHEINTASGYIYVTPAGNYSFPKITPWAMSYTSLWGNTTGFSTYAIEEASGTYLTPGTYEVKTTPTSIAINSRADSARISARLSYLHLRFFDDT